MYCVAALSVALFSAGCRPAERPNLLLIVIDTLRADHLGAWGYERGTSPTLDELAHDHLRFEWAFSTAPWTAPSVASMFTGLYPTGHGVLGHIENPEAADTAEVRAAVLSDDLVTLAESLQDNGYRTAGATANAWVSEKLGFAQGFDRFETFHYSRAHKMTRKALELLDSLAGEQPFFLYVHYMDPHAPYNPPGRETLEDERPLPELGYEPEMLDLLDRYDREIHYADGRIGELFAALKERGLWQDTSILVVGDHGEQFGEQGSQGHGFGLYNTEVRVPLILKAGHRRGVVGQPVSVVDVFATLLDLAGVGTPQVSAGVSLLGTRVSERQGVLVEATAPWSSGNENGEDPENHKGFVRRDLTKLLMAFEGHPRDLVTTDDEKAQLGLWDLERDAREEAPLADRELGIEMRRAFFELYREAAAARASTPDRTLPPETVRELRSLGYLE